MILDAGKHAVYLDRLVTTAYDSKMHVKPSELWTLVRFPREQGYTAEHVNKSTLPRRREPGVEIRDRRMQLRRHRQKL